MRTFKIAAAGLLLGVSGIALAQDAPEGGERDEFGVWVSGEAQTNAQSGGIGATVSEEARLQGELRSGNGGDNDLESAEDIDAADDGTSEGIGASVSAAARAAAEDLDRVGGVASSVLAEVPANPRALEAVTAAGQAAAQGRTQADLARQNAQSARENAASARENARSAADQARAVRDTVAGARGRGR